MAGQDGKPIEARLDRIEAGQEELKSGQTALVKGQEALAAGLADLRRHLHVLHEDTMDKLRAIPTNGPSRTEMNRRFDEMAETMGRRLDPLEAAVRRLSVG